jgi:hypothetical protein
MKKYSKADEAYLIERYTANPTSETVDMLAEDFGVTRRSIIGKLATLKVYRSRPSYKPKYGEAPVSKEHLVETLANLYELDVEKLRGLEAAKKDSLLYLVQKLQEFTPT